MVDAVLSGDGLERVAELASRSAGGAVTIILPRLAAAVIAPSDAGGGGAWASWSVTSPTA
jgi:hypothetical protein